MHQRERLKNGAFEKQWKGRESNERKQNKAKQQKNKHAIDMNEQNEVKAK